MTKVETLYLSLNSIGRIIGRGRGKNFAGFQIFDPLDSEQDLLLVTKADDPYVLQILPCELRDVINRGVALTPQRRAVLVQSQQMKPLF